MPPKAAKAKKLPKEVLNDSKLEVWREGLKTGLHSSDPDAELIELFGMFKKIAGKDKICTRAEFLKSFEKKAKIEGEPVAVKDVETLFNVSAIDYDYNTVSLHEFMMLMITIRGGNPQLKLQWIFKMYDKDESGYLSPDEVENLLLSLLTAETNVRAATSRTAVHCGASAVPRRGACQRLVYACVGGSCAT
eukprot:1424608-Prymnesium_polylepis.1